MLAAPKRHMLTGPLGAVARTIINQAERLGCSVDVEVAQSRSIYITLAHPTEDGELLVRVADHAPNEARYMARVNREPDVFCEPGWQADAVRKIAEWVGVDPEDVPYLRAAATRERKAREARETVRREAQSRAEAWRAECERKHAATIAAIRAALTAEDLEWLRSLDWSNGKVSRAENNAAIATRLRPASPWKLDDLLEAIRID